MMCLPLAPRLAAVLLAIAPAAAGSTAGRHEAADYLTDEYFPGYHVLVPEGSTLLVYEDSRKPREDGKFAPLVIHDVSRWGAMKDAREALNATLRMQPLESMQTPWSLFDSQGRRLDAVGEMLALPFCFLIMLGQWMWPGVRIGFEQQTEGVLWGQPLTMRTLSLRPMVFQIDGFILPDETEELKNIGRKSDMVNSQGVLITEDVKANRAHDSYRTSTQTWLRRARSAVVADLDDRTANLTRIPASHNEPVQLLRYGQGQFYHSHLDWADLRLYNGQREQYRRHDFGWSDRVATLFWYLNDVPEGGETVFPKHGDPICSSGRGHCKGSTQVNPKACNIGLRVSPKRGRVVLWYNFLPDGRGDHNALHGGCPPAEGLDKWSANKWIGTKPRDAPMPAWDPKHPALKRFGWKDNALQQPDDLSCQFTMVSNLPDESAELMWVNDDKEHVPVTKVSPGVKTSMNSYDKHAFVVRASGKSSEPMVCKKPSSHFVVAEDFSVQRAEGSGASETLEL